MTIRLSLTPDEKDAFDASLEHFYSTNDHRFAAENFLDRCAKALIASARKGEAIIAPLKFVSAES